MHDPVNYNDGVNYDTESMRIEICPRCGNSQFSPEAGYCRICGLDLFNYCEGEQIVYDGEYRIVEGTQHKNPSNARFCETCGRKTTFFMENVLCSFDKFIPEEEDTSSILHDVPDFTETIVPVEEPAPAVTVVDSDELPF